MANLLYHFGRTLEAASVRLGIGKFEVPETYQCKHCRDDSSLPECSECRAVWLHEIGQLDYSDAFERRLNITLGLLCLPLAGANWLLNNILGVWEFGPFLGALNAVLSPFSPKVEGWPALLRYIYILILGSGSILCAIGLWAVFGITFFFMGSNPTGRRHWRHMTPSAIIALMVFSIFQFMVVLQGLSVMDLVMVFSPGMMGMVAFALVLCMRKSSAEKPENGEVKLV